MQGKFGLFPRFYQSLLPVVVIMIGCTVALAQPRTMYKPHDVENARQNIESHDWAREIVNGWKSDVSISMRRDREFFQEFISDLTPGTWYGQNCPACVGDKSAMGQGWLFRWVPSRPDQVQCTRCSTVYPNEEYPETGVLECPRMGQTFTYYETPEERANPDERGKHALQWLNRPQMTSFSGMVRMYRNHWAWQQALTLAKLYAVTGEVAYAERAAWIVDRFAQVYPNLLYHDYTGAYADWPPMEVAANFGEHGSAGRFPRDVVRHAYGWDQWGDDTRRGVFNSADGGAEPDEGAEFALGRGGGAGRLEAHGGRDGGPLVHLSVAYDLIRDARYADGTTVLDDEMEQRILRDLIREGAVAEMSVPATGNQAGHSIAFKAAAGVILQEPDIFRHALEMTDRVFDARYHFDGHYNNTPGYTASNFARFGWVPDILLGYSDPPGYQPAEGARIDNFNPYETGRLRLALLAMVRMMGPGYARPVIGNTKPDGGLSPAISERLLARLGAQYATLQEHSQGAPLHEAGSEYALWFRPADLQIDDQEDTETLKAEWFPAWHVGVLRGGRPDDTALYLVGNEHRWTLPGTGHRHHDILGISFYAFGEELASDRGYFSGSAQRTPDGLSGQHWTMSTKSHNLVVVDDQDQRRNPSGSNLELFGVSPGVEVIQASGFRVYEQCDEYRRTCAVIRTPDEQNYVVDFFRVRGGQTHHYSFHCNGELVALAPDQPEPQPFTVPRGQSHGYPWTPWNMWLTNARAVTPHLPYTFTWMHNEVRLDLTMLNTDDTIGRIIVADAPGWRQHAESVAGRPPIQQILAENRSAGGDAPLATQYAAVIVPYQADTSPVLSARMLANDYESGAMAVEVRFADRTDYIISTRDQQQRQFGPVTVSGEFAFVSVDNEGNAVQGYLLKGTDLQCGELNISLPEPQTRLKVSLVSDRTYHLADTLPAGLDLTGAFLLVCGDKPHPDLMQQWTDAGVDPGEVPRPRTGFAIDSVTTNSITVRDYPVPECDEIAILHSGWVTR